MTLTPDSVIINNCSQIFPHHATAMNRREVSQLTTFKMLLTLHHNGVTTLRGAHDTVYNTVAVTERECAIFPTQKAFLKSLTLKDGCGMAGKHVTSR